MNLPQDIANQALDAIGWPQWIGDLEEGTPMAQVLLRAYSQCLRQLLRAAHWNFARRQTSLVLLADASGQTQAVGTLVPRPWLYEYAYPIDCMKARFVPMNWRGTGGPAPPGNYVPPNAGAPIVSGLGQPPWAQARLQPARFLEMTDPNYPVPPQQNSWEVQGISPQGRTVLCTNVRDAELVYTALMNYPSNWDPLFRAAFVAYLASEVALPVWTNRDRAFGLRVRDEQIKLAGAKIMQARATDGNEGWFSSDITPDWMRFRNVQGGFFGRGSGDGGLGIVFGGCDGCCGIGSTSAF